MPKSELKQRLRTEWAKLDHVVIAVAFRHWPHG